MKDLPGKTVLVAGAARVGKVIALAFAAEKTRVVNTGRAPATPEATQIDSSANG